MVLLVSKKDYKSDQIANEVAVVVVKAMGLGCLMVLMLILSTSHAGEADEEDDTVSSNQINIYLTIPKDCNPRNEMEKRAWNRGFYLGIGKRLSDNLNVQGIVTMFMKVVYNTRSIRY